MAKSKLSRWHNRIISQLGELGLQEASIRKSKHIVVTGKLNNESFRWVTSSTPSRTVAYKQMIADLKRELKRCGLHETQEFSMKFFSFFNDEEDIWNLIRQVEAEFNDVSDKS